MMRDGPSASQNRLPRRPSVLYSLSIETGTAPASIGHMGNASLIMLNLQSHTGPDTGGAPPLFSIIIPLEYHRGQWERAWLAWTEQTVDRSLYEIILVVPPDFPHRAELSALGQLGARLEFADSRHDIGLCAIGASRARGDYLFFTEAHCRPEPDVLALCISAFAEHPDWAGFSCRSVPICHNLLSEAEAEMYQADIEFGMKVHPWRKILDQCFVTRRAAYEQCGGLQAEFGHFAEWLLAAGYHARGHRLGYLEEARIHHYYVGELDGLKSFTRDFVEGEIRFFSDGARGPGGAYLEAPVEWICQDDFDAGLARDILRALLRFDRPEQPQLGARWRAIRRWLGTAAFGDGLARSTALAAVLHARCGLSAVLIAGSRESVFRWFKRYIAALIRLQRLNCIHAIRRATTGGGLRRLGDGVLSQAGFYPVETWSGRPFRWSETEAAVRIPGRAGRRILRIQSPPIRGPLDRIGVRFYLDGACVADSAVAIERDAFVLGLDLPASGTARLAWTCPRFEAVNDPRHLGLPVAAIDIDAEAG